ncbi:MAG: Peptidase [Myxococcales bacterium]|nr:Peptidase [Myxococcales bacterium]
MARRRRKRRSAEVRNSLRLGALLAALVGINVYVFFFNHGTAPREVLNLQSTSKSMDGTRRELLGKDAARATLALATNSTKPTTKLSTKPGTTPTRPASDSSPAPKAPATSKASSAAAPAAPPVFHIPFSVPVSASAGAAASEDDGEAVPGETTGEDGVVEKQFSNAATLGQVLAREGFGAQAGNVISALAKLVDPKTIRPGQKYLVRLDDSGVPEAFEYQPSVVLRYLVERDENGAWNGHKSEQPVETKTIEAGGVVESSLYESVQKTGESTTLVGTFVELFAWDVNFYVDQHPGDHWKIVVEKQLLGGKFYKYGRILAAEYGGKVGTFRVFWFAGRNGKGQGRYFDEHGEAISKTMLKTPLRFVRISSKFDRKRFHPILHVEKAHLGIDYAAPVGTPVWASAGGRVLEAGMKRGSGNTVVISHANGINTRYYHLSRFARGLHAGQIVKQKDVIGFVGTTGLSTGPHLHFSVTKNGAFVDPNKMQINRDAPVADRAGFLDSIRPRLAALKAIQPGAVARN